MRCVSCCNTTSTQRNKVRVASLVKRLRKSQHVNATPISIATSIARVKAQPEPEHLGVVYSFTRVDLTFT